ncbi:MAG: phosphoesterase [Bacteroidota bacterium]
MKKLFPIFLSFVVLIGCATYNQQFSEELETNMFPEEKEVQHSFFVLGDVGAADNGTASAALQQLQAHLKDADENSTVVFLGNSTLSQKPTDQTGQKVAGMPILDRQIQAVQEFKGNSIFIPGKSEWSGGVEQLRTIEKYVDDKLGKNSFLPERGCPIEDVKIGDDIILITIDSQWYLSDWNKHPKINDNCDIRDRESFFEEIESLVKKNVGKTMLIAVHHPMFSNGPNGGQYSFGQSMTPLPVLGTAKNVIKKTGGLSSNSLQNSEYRSFRKRLTTLAQYNNKVIFLSGHEHSMQYIFSNNVHQVISGAGAKQTATRNIGKGRFSYGKQGYARVDIFTDGSSHVRFFDADDGSIAYQNQLLPADQKFRATSYSKNFPKRISASVYDSTDTDKSGFHKFWWGERYRKYYGTKVSAPTVDLDTLFGGLKVLRKGGGHQSKSLRLENKEGKQYVMRALEKSAEAYLQAMVAKEEFIIGKTEGSAPNRVLMDFYTGDHPYAPFTIGTLSDAVGIYHTNPVLYYIPRQEVLGIYNDEFADKLYMIEERATGGHGDQKSFGYSNNLISTYDLMANIASDEKYSVDVDAYIRARLFDMLIGDWDRHNDQWRWAEFEDKETGNVVYRPVPRDRDQAYSIMGDGALMSFATKAIPSLRLMVGFDDEIKSVKGFNSSPKTFSLDKYILPESTLDQWLAQAQFIQQNINGDIIDAALAEFPVEVQDETVGEIKRKLLSRKDNLQQTAQTYYEILNKKAVVVGTDKDDYFLIEDSGDGKTKVTAYRIKKGKKDDIFFTKEFDKKTTKEIWLYGLDDDDYFEVKSDTRVGPKLRLIGGQNNDIYDISRRRKTRVYDYKTQNNTFKNKGGIVKLTNNYEINTYNPFKVKASTNQLIPTIGSNPDDGFRIGISDTYTHNGFIHDPFTSQHTFGANFYFATSGYDFSYRGEFARTIGNAALQLEAKYTSPNFAINFFGFGNETPNFDDDLDFDFNRVKIEELSFAPSLLWRGRFGSKFRLGASIENFKVEETEGRFIETFYDANPELDNENSFWGVDAEYSFENADNNAFPTLGLAASIHVGYTGNINESDEGYGYLIPSLSVDYKLVPSGALVLASKLKSQINFGDDFQFYQAATIGAEDGLRGYRFQRFTGKSSFYQSTDLRASLKRVRTSFLPLTMGLYGGFDYGRVWVEDDDSNTWNTSYGGGFFVNAVNMISARAAIFSSDDGIRFSFGIGFGF